MKMEAVVSDIVSMKTLKTCHVKLNGSGVTYRLTAVSY